MSQPKKIQELLKTADETAKQIQQSSESQHELFRLMAFFFYEELYNLFLLYNRNKEARTLKTYEQWQQEKRYVMKGESAIQLLKKTNQSFKTMSLFDISQTTADEQKKAERKLIDKQSFYSLVEKEMATINAQRLTLIRYMVYHHFGIPYAYFHENLFVDLTIETFLKRLEEIRTEAEKTICAVSQILNHAITKQEAKTLNERLQRARNEQHIQI